MICITWNGFPQYAARCVCALTHLMKNERIVVVATPPSVPIKGMESVCGCDIIWVDSCDKCRIEEIVGEIPRVIFLSGWSVPVFERFRIEVKRNGGLAILMSDRNWAMSNQMGSLFGRCKLIIIEILRFIRFKFMFKNKYDIFLVPGKSGAKLMKSYGIPEDKIFTGMYSADKTLFHNGNKLSCRAKKIIYVGRFVDCKNVLRMIEAFIKALNGNRRGWTFMLFGSGPLKDEIQKKALRYRSILSKNDAIIQINDFKQPEELAHYYREARLFCLPSIKEPWGVVVHEAALSGCLLLLGNVGSIPDFLMRRDVGDGYVNGYVFNPYSILDMTEAISRAMDMTNNELNLAQETSLKMADSFCVDRFANSVKNIVEKC